LDSPIFPATGFSIFSRYDQSLTKSGSSSIFRVLNIEGRFMQDFNIPVSFALWAKAGTDFSDYADAAETAPFYHKPKISDRQFMPGPLEVQERIGSHIAGVGTEIKYQLRGASWAAGFPSFLLLQASQGTVLPDVRDIDRASDFTHWTGAVGLGIRLTMGLGYYSVSKAPTGLMVSSTRLSHLIWALLVVEKTHDSLEQIFYRERAENPVLFYCICSVTSTAAPGRELG
jgi:hypothetical protein